MLKNYLKIIFRNLLHNPSYSIINILGLAIGISACLTIVQYVSFERSYDRFHENFENIYRMRVEGKTDAGQMQFQSARNFSAAGPEVTSSFEEIENYTRFRLDEMLISHIDEQTGDKREFVEDKLLFADTAFFKIFSFPIVLGDPGSVMKEPYSVMLSEAAAEKYFGSDWAQQNILGKSLLSHSQGEYPLIVTGVFNNIPINSHFKFDILISYSSLLVDSDYYHTNWSQNSLFTYLKVSPGVDPRELEAKFPAIIDTYKGDYFKRTSYREDFYLQSLAEIHLTSHFSGEAETNGSERSVFFLSIIAAFILLIAWVNYINLTTSMSIDRGKEVGIRKVNGAASGHLIGQFLLETTIVKVISLLIAFTAIQFIMPLFGTLVGKHIEFTLWQNLEFIVYGGVILVVGILITGLYPALIVSRFNPAVVLKGKFTRSKDGSWIRKSLVVFQFAISMSLMAGTITVYKQLNFLLNHDLGVNIEKTLVVNGPRDIESDVLANNSFEAFKASLTQLPNVKGVSTSRFVPGEGVWGWGGYIRQAGAPPTDAKAYNLYAVDSEYIANYDLEMVAGRSFSKEIASDSTVVILSETAARKLGFENAHSAIGKFIYYPMNNQQNEREIEVIGVLKDFNQGSPKDEYLPMIFQLLRTSDRFYSIQFTGPADEFVVKAKNVYSEVYGDRSFNHFFLDDFYNSQYAMDQQFGRVFGIFSLLAIVVACLGLFGLASFSVKQRTKEVGIRKALGAPVGSILRLLTSDFLKLILISSLFALPVAFLFLSNWLDNYAVRIDLDIWFMVLPPIIVITAALSTIAMKTAKAALSNPVTSLRYE